ncbi:hypothetical protein GYMLUDRAFT_87215 [Collybiopsis luxurians FD-317 M1]|uniref:Uncharacterized protein n=1 Tax=Collybiopsis luxurians FD-317 M1 TaxID=944289 RepID=A0A0D0BNU2_9AGAR|nr:hypothetical protein GYMLUDRAFT_87215 [Collybiopsis luxurians FD-317 M1]
MQICGISYYSSCCSFPMSQSAPLTISESTILRNDGAFMLEYVPDLMVETFAWGFHIMALATATYALMSKTNCHLAAPKYTLLTAVLFMFLLSTTLFTLHIYQFAVQLKGIYLTPTIPGQTLLDKAAPSAILNEKASFASDILFALEFSVGDAIVLWRTWAIWTPNQSIVKIPIFFWFLSLLCLVIWIVTRLALSIIPLGWADFDFRNDDPQFLLLTNYALSLLVNGLSTALIGYKTWQNGRFIKAAFQRSSLTIQVQKTLSLLVESGLIYFVLFSIQLINFVPDPEVPGIVAAIIASLGDQLLGLYPTLIVILVSMQRTIWDSPELSQAGITEIAFGSVTRHTERTLEGNVSTETERDLAWDHSSDGHASAVDENDIQVHWEDALHSEGNHTGIKNFEKSYLEDHV